jgi:pilus assembly protein Flp/PilA
MNTILIRMYLKFQDLASREQGQDLVEYALVLALVSFGSTASMRFLASGLNIAFTGLSTELGSYVS